MKKSLFVSILFLSFFNCKGQVNEAANDLEIKKNLAFPGAEGFGKYTTGGRGGDVYVVTSLADDGPGSLREAIKKKGPRIIVFGVAGNIELQSELDINNGDLTIAGQSAPGEGITIQNYPIKVKGDNIIIRFIRSRMGDLYHVVDDAISATRQKDIIIDHCSFSWSTDECGSFYDNENFTLQWCILSESLNKSVHGKGDHGYGGIWGGKGASFIYNILAHHNSRNPRFNGSRYHKEPEKEIADFRNNLIYNWQSNSAYAGEKGNYNMVNNYFKPGPATRSNPDRIIEPYPPYGKFYLEGNFVEGSEEVTKDNAMGVHSVMASQVLAEEAFPYRESKTYSSKEAFELTLKYAGNSFNFDTIDQRLRKEIRQGTAMYGKEKRGIIDSQSDVGGWPVLEKGKAPKDSDGDGMPDDWELKNGLDASDPSDSSDNDLDQNYTNVEVYLNSLVSHLFPMYVTDN